jgi:hypothetical protein
LTCLFDQSITLEVAEQAVRFGRFSEVGMKTSRRFCLQMANGSCYGLAMSKKNELSEFFRLAFPPQDVAEWRRLTVQIFVIAIAVGYLYSVVVDKVFGVRVKVF